MMNILEKIVTIGFPADQYYREVTDKSQVCLHHTVSGRGVKGDITWWETDPLRIATCMIIHHDGTPYQLFSSRFWGHHLGIKRAVFDKYGVQGSNTFLNMACIGIEIDSWGPLMDSGGKWYPVKINKLTGHI